MTDDPTPRRPAADAGPRLTPEQHALAALLGRLLAVEWRARQPAPPPPPALRPEAA